MKIRITESQFKRLMETALHEYYNVHVPSIDTGYRQELGYTKLYTMKWDHRFFFGTFKGKKVEEVFAMGTRGKEYIGWVYYNKEMVTFEDEIKESLQLIPIEKPGTSKEIFEKWNKQVLLPTMSDEEKRAREIRIMADISHKRKVARDKAAYFKQKSEERTNSRDEKISKAGRLAWANQGHGTIKESVLKKIIKNTILESVCADPVHELYYEIGEKAKDIVDYLYNEGVVAYDDEHLKAMAKNISLIDFDDIYSQIVIEYGLDLPPKALKVIEDRLKTGSNPELDDQVLRGIQEYEKKAHEYLNAF